MRRLLMVLLTLSLLLASGCSSTKSQHEQAVEWIAFYSGVAQQVQADAHMLQTAVGNLYLGATPAACTAVAATARMVAADLDAEPERFTARLGPGRVSDAAQSLRPATTALKHAVGDVAAICGAPTHGRQALVDQYSSAAAAWNAALVAIWTGAERPLPPVLGF